MEDANNSMSSRYRIINILQLYWHSLAKLSILIANRYGDSTEPCLTPKSTLNISDQSPLQILSFQQVNFFLRSPRSSLTNGRRYGTVVRVINFILFTLQLALWTHSNNVALRFCTYQQTQHWSFSINSHILCVNDPPTCQLCGLPVAVRHILVECVGLRNIRTKYFTVFSVADLFQSVNNSIIDLLDSLSTSSRH